MNYAVTSTANSVIYFGGFTYDNNKSYTDRVAEFKNLEWTLLGNLAGPRKSGTGQIGHRSIKMGTKIYVFGT